MTPTDNELRMMEAWAGLFGDFDLGHTPSTAAEQMREFLTSLRDGPVSAVKASGAECTSCGFEAGKLRLCSDGQRYCVDCLDAMWSNRFYDADADAAKYVQLHEAAVCALVRVAASVGVVPPRLEDARLDLDKFDYPELTAAVAKVVDERREVNESSRMCAELLGMTTWRPSEVVRVLSERLNPPVELPPVKVQWRNKGKENARRWGQWDDLVMRSGSVREASRKSGVGRRTCQMYDERSRRVSDKMLARIEGALERRGEGV